MKIKSKLVFKSDDHKRQTIVHYAQEILRGVDTRTLLDDVVANYNMNHDQAKTFLTEVRDVIAETTAENNEKVVQVHTLIYEDIYKRLMQLSLPRIALKALKQKEELLKLYEDETQEVVINNQTNVSVNVDYNISKLSDEQQQRMMELIGKTYQ